MKKVNIILPAYNGEKYIGEQIESILNQTYGNIDLYIRDDKSSDETIAVVKKYIGKEPQGKRIILIDNENTNWGYVKNVFETLRLTDNADYYAFCDQDDVWLPSKIEKQVEILEKQDNTKPALCFTAYNFCNSRLEFVKRSIKYADNLGLEDVVYDFKVLNFNIMINHALREFFFAHLPSDGKYPNYPDFWMSQVAAGYHGLCYIEEPMVNYRRNDNAASFFNHNKFSFLIWRVKKLLFGEETKLLKKALHDYYDCYGKELDDKDNKMMEILTRPTFFHYFEKIFYPKRFRSTLKDEIALRVFFVLGKL